MIDSHAHLAMCSPSIETLWDRATAAGVTDIINVALTIESGLEALKVHETFPRIYPTIGFYPSEFGQIARCAELETLVKKHPFKAIGEIGLDYLKNYGSKTQQRTLFETQLDIADRCDLPVIIHSRHADDDMISILSNFTKVKKVLHCFASSPEVAEALLNDNTFFSFTAMATYAKRGKTIRAIEALPCSKIMIETDCPYLTPKAKQGQENEPALVGEIAKKIAEIKKMELSQTLKEINSTTKQFFDVK